jgi:hypothetical protein
MTVEFDATHNLYTNVVASNSNDVLTVKIKIGKSLGNEWKARRKIISDFPPKNKVKYKFSFFSAFFSPSKLFHTLQLQLKRIERRKEKKKKTNINISRVLIMMISIHYFTMIFLAIKKKLKWKRERKNSYEKRVHVQKKLKWIQKKGKKSFL